MTSAFSYARPNRRDFLRFVAGSPLFAHLWAEHASAQQGSPAIANAKDALNVTDFEELARTKSVDPSASNGGDLGFFGPGEMIPAFEQAAMALKVGEISGVVQTPIGFHIIKRIE